MRPFIIFTDEQDKITNTTYFVDSFKMNLKAVGLIQYQFH